MKIGIISLYPPKEATHAKLGGVASYTKNLVDSFPKKLEITVFANKINNKEEYSENTVKVIRCWKKGSFYPFQILQNIKKTNAKVFHIQHEYFLYGNVISTIMFPFLLLMLKILGKKLIVTLHGVVPIDKVNRTFMKENNIILLKY